MRLKGPDVDIKEQPVSAVGSLRHATSIHRLAIGQLRHQQRRARCYGGRAGQTRQFHQCRAEEGRSIGLT